MNNNYEIVVGLGYEYPTDSNADGITAHFVDVINVGWDDVNKTST